MVTWYGVGKMLDLSSKGVVGVETLSYHPEFPTDTVKVLIFFTRKLLL